MLDRERVCFLALMVFAATACELEIESEEPGPHDAPSEDDPGQWPWAAPEPVISPWPPPPSQPEPGPNPQVEEHPVDPYRELVVTEPRVVRDSRAAEALEGAPWSLRSQLRWLAGSADDDVSFTLAWLEEWRDRTSVGEHGAPLIPRPKIDELLVSPWFSPGSSPTGGNDGASYGSYGSGDTTPPSSHWSSFPFQLIAIVNRIDLASGPCSGSAGELRFVYTGLDPAASRPLNLTLILEVPYPQDRTPSEWAAAWHALGSLSPGESYNAELERLTRAVREGADPFSARLRTNEQALGTSMSSPWELREFRLERRGEGRRLVHATLEFTPPSNVDRAALDTHLVSHADAVLGGAVTLPPELRGGAAQVTTPSFTWPASNLGESLRKAFSRETCNGCHGGDTATLPFQHIAPSTSAGAARLSRFLDAPGSENDELSRRKAALESLLEQSCDPAPASSY